MKRVIVIGLDGFDPKLTGRLLERGELPNLARLIRQGGWGSVRTTFPALTPVAWSTFATGTNPGGHGIYDFIRRDAKTYLPDLSFSRYERRNAFLPPRAVNLRRGATVWEHLSKAGIPSVVLRFPCSYPPDNIRGRMLAGMGVPDLRGGLGTATLLTGNAQARAGESEQIVYLEAGPGSEIETFLPGPRDARSGDDARLMVTIRPDASRGRALLRCGSETLELQEGEWSRWLDVSFRHGLFQSLRGIVRFLLISAGPVFELYASPVNFDPAAPPFAISSPAEYGAEMRQSIGTFYTAGMPEDHNGLNNGRYSEESFLSQCELVLRERERMMAWELERFSEGLFYILFDTPDRIQHMFWRHSEVSDPLARQTALPHFSHVITEHYRACDEIVGRAMQYVDDETLLIVCSDHGMNSFERGVHLNTLLHDQGLLSLRRGISPGEAEGDFLQHVDWDRTYAYALGLGGIYINLKGREERGIVSQDGAANLKQAISESLTGLGDEGRGRVAVRRVLAREQIYTGPYADESPDLLVNFAAGYRASWATALGGVPAGHFEDNLKKWSGDHIIDPVLVPGVVLMNRPYRSDDADLRDMAPTILAALGVTAGNAMEGASLLL